MQKIYEYILDTLFPKKCFSCGKEDTWLCESCKKKIALCTTFTCPLCGKGDGPTLCASCKEKSPLDELIYAVDYNESEIVRRIIHAYKYKSIKSLDSPLGHILITALEKNNYTPSADYITSVPLHKRRTKERGFNQATLIALFISKKYQIPFSDLLTRTQNTTPQMSLNKEERKRNIAGAFHCTTTLPLKNKTIIIVDDVATTLSTLEACAKELKKCGAKKVIALCIARDR
ncbi:ComF family protein [Patescibacteria group bacterium]|nr:ComF family protein [Patescibacteria group bacterium]